MTNVENTQHSSSSLWSNCRPDIQRRINALLNYQAEYFRLRVEFHRQLQDLQYAYQSDFERILEQQRTIINGSTDQSSTTDSNFIRPDLEQIQNLSTIQKRNGIENFWLIVLKNVDSYDFAVQRRDELCLKYLIDIRCRLSAPNHESTSFTLEFHFLPSNPFFIETILTKQYSVRFESNDSYPYQSYDGPEVDRCYGCSITWKPGQNLTSRKRTKRIRNKSTGQVRFVQSEETIKSFFNFFSPPAIPESGIHEMNDEDQMRLEADIEFGLLLKQSVLPRAILYYTGEAASVFNDNNPLTSSDSSID